MDQVVIRRAKPEDVDTIAHLWEALVAYHGDLDPSLPPSAPQGARRYARRLLDRIDDPMSRLFVSEVDGKVVGYVLGVIVELAPEMFQQEASGFLADLFVEEGYRRSGLGRGWWWSWRRGSARRAWATSNGTSLPATRKVSPSGAAWAGAKSC